MVPHVLVARAVFILLQNGSKSGIDQLMEFSTLSVLIAVLALLIMVGLGFAVFLFGFVRLLARR